MPYLQTKLSVGGMMIPDNLLHHLSGPVAKAAGKMDDVRLDDKQYQSMGWAPITNILNNAWGRLLVRLYEIEQSLELIHKMNIKERETNTSNFFGSGEGAARVESPRGTLKLRIAITDGKVEQVELETPSKQLDALVPTLTEEAELSDALVQIASLDIAPWEVEPKGAEVDQ